MDQLIPSLEVLLEPLGGCVSRGSVQHVLPDRRSMDRVPRSADHQPRVGDDGAVGNARPSAAFRLFSAAAWNWDEVCRILILDIVAQLVPGMRIWVVVDDTLCHKRGAKVAFGGIFLDAVLSTRKHKVFRFGNNWVLLGIVVQLPFRKDRYFCLPSLVAGLRETGKEKPQRASQQESVGGRIGEPVRTLVSRPENPGCGRLCLCRAASLAEAGKPMSR